ncbi:MAG TPA: hemolysin III family protein [Dehalococcoidia bacterium]|nr:hemolysin III family protein [Dehalococcoidia bacterium]
MTSAPTASPAVALARRPLLRGVPHLAALVAVAVGGAALLLLAQSPRGYVGGAVFVASLLLLYGTSAAYHRITWMPRYRTLMQRLDHSMIFVLIAGTYTPFCLLVLDNGWGISMLSVIWGLAGAGILLKLAWPRAPRWLGISAYVIVGWTALVPALELTIRMAVLPLALIALGGVLYTLGGLVYGLRRPDPWPRVFGYHEVFHTLVIGGSAVHYLVVASYVIS